MLYGKITVAYLPRAHPAIQYLITDRTQNIADPVEREEVNYFRKKVRYYNGLFAFAGIQMHLDLK